MPERAPDEKQIFLAALEQGTAQQREAYLQGACAGDAELLMRVNELLSVHEQSQGPLDGPPPGLGSSRTIDLPPTERPGTVIGPYKLLQQIGEGGMGTVFMAEQTHPVQRKVALKVIKPGMDSRQVIARFEAERQALAMMDHVNIARVLDAGTIPVGWAKSSRPTMSADEPGEEQKMVGREDLAHPTLDTGRPYFVMELVHGVPITKYCDDNHLTPRERLELFVPVCQAIQHAHQKGVIHRDIKPSNVMITLYDGKPVPKVIDFGVAKATEQRLTERTVFTQYGTMVGTLEYMSPEQAEMSALGVDTRSDIYSLGVLLYELLTGSTPLTHKRLKEAGYGEILRLIKEEEPPKPSTRLSDSGESLASISAQRQMEPDKLTKLLRGELDWIVMKTLEKDRNRRYETAKDFAADVERYLNDEPVQACPPSVGYRLRKLVRRHRRPVLAASLVLLALVGGIIGTTWGMLRATSAEAVAVHEAKQKGVALTDREAALADATDQLFLALVSQARAARGSGRVGQRFEALDAIQQAARIRITPELRTEAMAALILPDAELAQEWEPSTEDSGIGGVFFDASLQRYARLDKQGGVTVCRLSNGREEIVTRLPADGKTPVWSLLMSPDARFVACGHGPTNDAVDGRVRVWKVNGTEPTVLLDEQPGINESAIAFHPSSRQLAVGHADMTVSVYDLATGRRVQRLAVSAAPFHLAFHPQEHRLAVACGNAVQLFDTDTGKELPALRHPAAVTTTWHLSWHPDGRRLAAGCNDRKVYLWDTQTATEVMSPWTGHTVDGLTVAFNHDGDRLASGDWGGTTRLWDAVAGRTLLSIRGNFGFQFSSDGHLFGPEYSGNKVRLWRLGGGRELRVLHPRSTGSLDNITSPVVHADGRTLAAAARDQLCFFDLDSGEELASVRLPRADAARPAFFDPPHLPPSRPDEKSRLQVDQSAGWMTGGYSGLYLWPARQDAARPEVMRIGRPQPLAPNLWGSYSTGASASADGRVVAVPQGSSTLVLYRDRPDRRVVLGPQYDVRYSAVSPDGRWVVTCSWGVDGRSKTVRIWDAETGLPANDLSQEGFATATFSPDGRWLMTKTSSGSRQWEVETWREIRGFDGGSFAFTADSRLLAINDEFGVIRLLETTTGREVARLTGPEPTGYAPACFTPDGTQLVATCSAETALYVWDLRLIRKQLKELGLDWYWPDFPATDPDDHAAKPRVVEVSLGDFGKPLTPEQAARQAIEFDPKSPIGHINLGNILFAQRKVDEAIACYQKAIELKPDGAIASNDLAWLLATCPEPTIRDAARAVELASAAVELDPQEGEYWNTLGVAHYRAGYWKAAATALSKSMELRAGGDSFDTFFLAMTHWQEGNQDEAHKWLDRAVAWMDKNKPQDDELKRFRAEAEEVLGVHPEKDGSPASPR